MKYESVALILLAHIRSQCMGFFASIIKFRFINVLYYFRNIYISTQIKLLREQFLERQGLVLRHSCGAAYITEECKWQLWKCEIFSLTIGETITEVRRNTVSVTCK